MLNEQLLMFVELVLQLLHAVELVLALVVPKIVVVAV